MGFIFAAAIVIICISVIVIIKNGQSKRESIRTSQRSVAFCEDTPDFIQDRIEELMKQGNGSGVSVSKTVKRVTYTRSDGTSHTTETVTENRSGVAATVDGHVGTVTCEACGGIAKLRKGQSGVCEYCGSHIQG